MLSHALLVAALAAVCVHEACSAIPVTKDPRMHPLSASNSGPHFSGRRRVRDTQVQLTTSSPLQTTSPPLGPYFANYSLIGQEVECSEASKRCLAINRLLDERNGMCYELSDDLPCHKNGGKLILDSESFRQGQLRSRCSEPRSFAEFNMAYDGKSYFIWDLIGKLCIGSKEVMYHPFGGLECKVPNEKFRRVKEIRQPNSAGRCTIPNLQNANIGPFLVQCSTAEEECLKKGLLPFGGSCQAPLSSSLCPEGQWLVLDEEAAESGRLIAKCNSSRPCGSDAQLLHADRSCHANEELFKILCKGSYIFPVPTGDFICTPKNRKYDVLSLKRENGLCRFLVSPGFEKPTIGV